MRFPPFLSEMSLLTAVTALLTLGVMFVNGWTDAPNAIATCVSTRSMRPRAAIVMAAVMNLAGILVMTSLQPTVAQTLYHMVDFGSDSHGAAVALCAAMTAIVIWAVAAWRFGIPTSESHALIAGLTGAAIAMRGGLAGINPQEWVKVLYGLILSVAMGFLLGLGNARALNRLSAKLPREKGSRWFRRGQALAGAGSAFMHGAQDGQKFIGVFLLGLSLAKGQASDGAFSIPLWLMLLCSLAISLGTSLGGYRIIKSVGFDMVQLEPHEGFAADLAAGVCLLLSSLGGLPVSTTHTKTTAIMGVGAARRLHGVNWGVARDMAWAWVLTFPGCGLIGWATAMIFLRIF